MPSPIFFLIFFRRVISDWKRCIRGIYHTRHLQRQPRSRWGWPPMALGSGVSCVRCYAYSFTRGIGMIMLYYHTHQDTYTNTVLPLYSSAIFAYSPTVLVGDSDWHSHFPDYSFIEYSFLKLIPIIHICHNHLLQFCINLPSSTRNCYTQLLHATDTGFHVIDIRYNR